MIYIYFLIYSLQPPPSQPTPKNLENKSTSSKAEKMDFQINETLWVNKGTNQLINRQTDLYYPLVGDKNYKLHLP